MGKYLNVRHFKVSLVMVMAMVFGAFAQEETIAVDGVYTGGNTFYTGTNEATLIKGQSFVEVGILKDTPPYDLATITMDLIITPLDLDGNRQPSFIRE